MSSVPTPSPTPAHLDPPTHGHAITVILALTITTAITVAGARAWARHVVLRQVDLDDLLIFLSVAFAIAGFTISRITYYKYGGNLHTWDWKDEYKGPWSKLIYITVPLYIWGLFCSKLSLLLFFRRLLSRVTLKRYRYVNDALIVILVTGTISFFFAQLLGCLPIEAIWKQHDKSYTKPFKCTKHGRILSLCTASFSIFTDFAIAIFPLWFIRPLKIRKEKKWPIAMILSLGFITCFFSVARIFVINAVYDWVTDVVWYRAYTQFLQLMEQNLAVICAAAPSLRIYFTRHGTNKGWGSSSYRKFSQSYVRPSANSSGRHNRKTKPSHDMESGFGTVDAGAHSDDNNVVAVEIGGGGFTAVETPPHAVFKRVDIDMTSAPKEDMKEDVELYPLRGRK